MDFYLIDYLCKADKDVWSGRSIVKAKNAKQAWEKFKKAWEKDLEEGRTDVPVYVIIKYSIERICSNEEALL